MQFWKSSSRAGPGDRPHLGRGSPEALEGISSRPSSHGLVWYRHGQTSTTVKVVGLKARSTLSFNAFFAGSRTNCSYSCAIDRQTTSCFRNCENMISIAPVEEVTYRQSRLCRLLGNRSPLPWLACWPKGKDLSTGEIAKAIGRSVPRTSNILGALRLAEVVRYETDGRYARYRLKHPREIRRILEALSGFVNTTSVDRR